MTDMDRWIEDGVNFGWTMPVVPRWKRWPIIRHIRTWLEMRRVNAWYVHGPGRLGCRSGMDEWILYGMWHGKEGRKP